MTLLVRNSTQICATCLMLLLHFVPGPALATADGPDYYRVVDVTANSVLNMRVSPNISGAIIKTIPSDADGIANLGCIGGLSFTEYEAAAVSERAASRKTRWCKVGYDRTVGWVAGWFLAEGGSEDGFRAGALLNGLAGSEWQVRDFAGEAINVEAWIAFKADGTVSGFGGCNQFKGSYIKDGRSLGFSPIAATMMACPETKMRVEQTLFKALDATHEVVATHLLLALFDDAGTLLATLTRRDWD